MIFGPVTKILSANFYKYLQGSGGSRELVVFDVFRPYLKDFSLFFHEIFIDSKILIPVLAAEIKSLIVSVLVTLETRLKVPILPIFDEWWRFLSYPFWLKLLT